MSNKLIWNNLYSKQDLMQAVEPSKFAIDNLELIKKAGSSLLDLGCGGGQDSILFAKSLINVTAVDFSETALRLLWKNIEDTRLDNVQSVSSSIETFLLNNREKYDVIYAKDSLHYFDSKYTRIVIDRTKDSLRTGGLFLMRVASTNDPKYEKGTEVDADMFMHEGQVKRFFSEDSLRRLLVGFKILRMEQVPDGSNVYWEVVCQRL